MAMLSDFLVGAGSALGEVAPAVERGGQVLNERDITSAIAELQALRINPNPDAAAVQDAIKAFKNANRTGVSDKKIALGDSIVKDLGATRERGVARALKAKHRTEDVTARTAHNAAMLGESKERTRIAGQRLLNDRDKRRSDAARLLFNDFTKPLDVREKALATFNEINNLNITMPKKPQPKSGDLANLLHSQARARIEKNNPGVEVTDEQVYAQVQQDLEFKLGQGAGIPLYAGMDRSPPLSAEDRAPFEEILEILKNREGAGAPPVAGGGRSLDDLKSERIRYQAGQADDKAASDAETARLQAVEDELREDIKATALADPNAPSPTVPDIGRMMSEARSLLESAKRVRDTERVRALERILTELDNERELEFAAGSFMPKLVKRGRP